MTTSLFLTLGENPSLALRGQEAGHDIVHYVNPSERQFHLVGKVLVKRTSELQVLPQESRKRSRVQWFYFAVRVKQTVQPQGHIE